jgi:outer membrane lipoprotein-sorting protein
VKIKLLALVAVISFVGNPTPLANAGNASADLSAADILKQTAEKYASLTSYSDEGSTVATLGTITAINFTFTIKLARTNLYQIAWWQEDQVYIPKGVVWSAGDGNFVWMGKNFKPQKHTEMELALASATGISGGAAASVPGTFFKLKWGNQLDGSKAESKRKADEKIGDVDCYVLTHGAGGQTNILWIGKQDLLIHQVENDTSGAFMKTTLEEQAKKTPQIRAMLEASGGELFKETKSIEIHRNILINPPLTKTDFDFKAPATAKP